MMGAVSTEVTPGNAASGPVRYSYRARGPFTTPRTRSPADSLSLRYRRAAVWSEIPVTSAMVRKDALGSKGMIVDNLDLNRIQHGKQHPPRALVHGGN